MATTWQTVRVFISSTFRDMHAERDHLVKVVFPRLRQWCERRRLHLVDIDLRWGVTKKDADHGKAIEICLQEIDGSRPFFLCLLGSRYGWVPDELPPEEMYRFRAVQKGVGSLLPERPEGCSSQKTPDPFLKHLSITHLEILHAALESIPTKEGKVEPVCQQAFFYFRDSKCLPAPEMLTAVEDEERKEYKKAFFEQLPDRDQMLNRLKSEIRDRYAAANRVFDYTGRWDAEADNPEDELLKGRLTDLQAFGERVESDVKRGITEQFAEHLAALDDEPDPLEQERALHEAFIEDRTQVHVPRIDVEQALTEYVQGDQCRPLVLSGPPGSGKSAILAHWVKRGLAHFAESSEQNVPVPLASANEKTFVVPRFIGASPASTSLHRLMENVSRELVGRFDLREEVEIEEPAPGGAAQKVKRIQTMEIPADPVELRRKWPKFLESAAARGRVVLVLDAVNQLDASADPLWLSWIPRKLPAGLKLIVSVLDHGEQSQPDYEPARGALGEGLPTSPESPTEGLPDAATDSSQGDLRSQASAGSGDPRTAADWLRSLRRIGLASKDERTEVPVLELDDEARRQIIHDLPSVFCKRLEQPQIDLLLQNQATRNPLFLLVALEELRVFGSFEKLPERIAKLPRIEQAAEIESALDAVFGQVLDRLERETRRQTPGLVPTLFRLLASAREGLSDQELSELLARQFPQFAEEIRNGAMHIVLRQLRRHLMRKGTEQMALIDFYHRSFWKAVRAKYLPDARPRHDVHHILAEYFDGQEWWLESLEEQRSRAQRLPPMPRPANPRKVAELSAQRFAVCREAKGGELIQELEAAYKEVEQLFTGLDFLESKNEAGLIFDLPSDFSQALKILPDARPTHRILKLLDEALRRDIHFIARHADDYPQALFQCLWNTCWWYDCPEAAKHYDTPEAGWSPEGTPWARNGSKLTVVLESWRAWNQASQRRFLWLRSLRPPPLLLNSAQRTILRGHLKAVVDLSFSPDGSLLASASEDTTVRVWDARTGKELAVFRGHKPFSPRTASFSEDGLSITSVSYGGTVRKWDVQTGVELMGLCSHSYPGERAAFSPDGAQIAIDVSDRTVRVWDPHRGEETAVLRGHEQGVTSVAFSSDGSRIATGSYDKTVRLWDAHTGEVLTVLTGHEDTVACVAFAHDGTRTASGSWDRTVRLWDAHTGEALVVLRGHKDCVTSVAFSPKPWRIATGSNDRTVRVWDADAPELLAVFGGCDDLVKTVAFSPDSALIAGGYGDGTVRLWDAQMVQQQAVLRGHPSDVSSLAYSPDGSRIASGSWDGTVRLWDAHTAQDLALLGGHEDCVTSVTFSPDGTRIASSSDDKIVLLWDARTCQQIAIMRGHEGPVRCIAFSPDGTRIASGSWDKTVRVWDAQNGDALSILCGQQGTVESVVFSLDGTCVAGGSWFANTVRVWEAESGECVEVIHGSNRVEAVAAETPSRALARDLETVIEDVATSQVIARFPIALEHIITHPSSRQWTGSAGNHVIIIALEGQLEAG